MQRNMPYRCVDYTVSPPFWREVTVFMFLCSFSYGIVALIVTICHECLLQYLLQSFAKSLLDVADNMGRASSVVKESFAKIDTSKDTSGAVPLLKTLLEGVEMTEKQLLEVVFAPFTRAVLHILVF